MPLMGLAAGLLRHRLAIQYPAESANSFGERDQLWQTVATVWGRVDPKGNLKPWVAQQADPQTTHLIELRYYPGLREKHRLVKRSESLTTIAGAVSSGSQTVTPGAMDSIVQGCVLWIGTEPTDADVVTVTAVTDTTFTAVFGVSHLAGASVAAARTYKLIGVSMPEEVHRRMSIEAREETLGTP